MPAARTWRHDVLDAMLKVAAVAGPIVVGLGIAFRRAPRFDAVILLVSAVVVLLVALRFLPQLPFRLRAGLTIAVLYAGGIPTLVRSGFSMGGAAAMVAAIVVAIILLGRGPAVLLLVVTALLMGALGAAAGAGHFVPRPLDASPLIASNWFRMGITFDLVTAMLVAAVEFAVLHIEKNYREVGQLNRRLESAKEDERRFIARELHDELGQTLTALKLRLKMDARLADPDRAAREAALTFSMIDGLIDRVRKLSLDLRPALLDEVGLIPALRAYLERQAAISEVGMELDVSGFVGRAAPESEIACFRIVQEAVTNVLRHAEACRVTVRLEQRVDQLQIVVKDDGCGILPDQVVDAAARGHMGLVGMRERARALGGDFVIESQPGGGTAVRVSLPVGRGGLAPPDAG
jgi:signal transduction histidine kinase